MIDYEQMVKNKTVVPKSLSGVRADALAQRLRALASPDLSLIPGPTRWNERPNIYKLFSDFHGCTVVPLHSPRE